MCRVYLSFFSAALFVAPVLANDWPYWRGPEQTGMTREKAPVIRWTMSGENMLWKAPIEGRTTPVVLDGRVVVTGPVGEGINTQERTVCLDAQTGDVRWEHRFNVFESDIVRQRLGWPAPCGDPETGNVYVHGTGGELFCYAPDGKIVWKRSLTEEFGRISGYGGRLHTPVVDENRVIISFLNSSWGPQAKPLHRYLALDKKTGEVIWWADTDNAPLDTTYAVPAIAAIGGKRMMIAAAADGWVYGFLARTGEKVWSYKLSKRGLNSSIVVDGDYAYVCHSEENYTTTKMGAVVCLDASKTGDITETGEVWRNDGLTVGYASPAIAKGRLYVVTNDAELIAFDAKTGKQHWQFDLGRVGKGSPTVTADGVIYVCEQNGIFHILRDEGDKCVSLDTKEFDMIGKNVDEMYGSPAVANGRVYFMARSGVYCLGKEDTGDVTAEIPPTPSAGPPSGGPMIFPAEVTLLHGDDREFKVTMPDGGEPSDVTWHLGVSGDVSETGPTTGRFTANADAASAGKLDAKCSTGSATARVRVCPKPPFTIGFEDMKVGAAPSGWIGASKKTEVTERDGGKVLRKLARKEFPSPPFMRLRTYLTPPIEGGCTVLCDMLGTPKGKRFKPDMGVINTRYRCIAVGMSNTLRIESWSPLPRLREEVPFEFDVNKWYTLKFEVRPDGDNAICRAKIWPRDEDEPADWMIEVTDPSPNREGAVGLYAYSTNTTAKADGPEVYYDNLKVTPNE